MRQPPQTFWKVGATLVAGAASAMEFTRDQGSPILGTLFAGGVVLGIFILIVDRPR